MSSGTRKALLCVSYAAAAAVVLDLLLVSAQRSWVILAGDWPSDPHAAIRLARQGLLVAGAASLLFVFVVLHSRRQRAIAVAASLLALGTLLGRTIPVFGHMTWELTGAFALSGALSCLCIGLLRRKGDPVAPGLSLAVALLPYASGLHRLYALLWFLPLLGTGALLGWLTAKVQGASRTKVAACLVAGVVLGALVIPIQLRASRLSWYGYHISLDCLQFGDINGDDSTDLMTHGYYGMAAGNFYWFAGRGDSFDDWRDSHWIDGLGQISGRLLDIDLDGDGDIVCAYGIYRNTGGVFSSVCGATLPSSQYNTPPSERFFAGLWECHGPVTVDVFGADLTGDGQMELLSIPKPRREHGGPEMIIGLRENDTGWAFEMFGATPGTGLENPMGHEDTLVLPQHPSAELVHFLESHHLRHRLTMGPLPSVPAGSTTVEYHWLDLDGDHKSELVICSEHTTGDSRWLKHFGGSGTHTPSACRLSVYRETSEGFHLLGSTETQPYICSRNNTPMPIQQFGDVDGDGFPDFLGQDGHVYLLREDWTFEQKPRIDLDNGDQMARLYLHDVNADGVPDAVSSFQPFWNIALGPLTQ